MPTPSVSVPQMTLSSPFCASCSTSTRYFGSRPAWCRPMPCLQPLADLRAVRAREPEARDRRRDRVLLLARADVEAREVLRAVRRVRLREVDDVDGRLALRRRASRACARAGSRSRRTRAAPAARPTSRSTVGRPLQRGQLLLEERRVAERRRHQQEARLRQREQRHLPGDAALAVGVLVELVHHDVVDRARPRPRAARCWRGSRPCSRGSGASRLTVASPVDRPTFSGPNSRQSAIHFSLTSALIGQV